jgi:hypothetical protein
MNKLDGIRQKNNNSIETKENNRSRSSQNGCFNSGCDRNTLHKQKLVLKYIFLVKM